MDERQESSAHNRTLNKYAPPRSAALLKEMKEGLDLVRSKVDSLTPKIRLIDKKLEYQIQKLVRGAGNAMENAASDEKKARASKTMEDPLKYLPNPDMLEKSIDAEKDSDAIYRPPKFAPTTMEEDKMSKQEKQALRKEKDSFQKAKQSAHLRALRDELEGRSQEVKETYGTESRELTRYMAKMEECAKEEEEHFIRAPITKTDKMREKLLKKSRNGLLALTDGFYDEVKALPLGDDNERGFNHVSRGSKKFNKRK